MRDLGIIRALQRVLGFGDLYSVRGTITVGVNDLDRAVTWYCDRLGLSVMPEKSYSAEVHLGYLQRETPMIVLFPAGERNSVPFAERHPILFTHKLDSVHAELASAGIDVGLIQSDSAGNRLFRFRDLEGNEIEVCVEP